MQTESRSTVVSIGQINAWNLFDASDDPRTSDMVYSPEHYATRIAKVAGMIGTDMGAPDIVALQEIENAAVLRALTDAPAMARHGYRTLLGDLADSRGIRNAILYRPDRVRLLGSEQPNPRSDIPVQPPGPVAPGRLFARPPIVARFEAVGAGVQGAAPQFTLIDNHFKSKLGGTKYEPLRRAQGSFVGGLVDAIAGAGTVARVIVTGDLNATYADGAYKNLERRGDGSRRLHDTLRAIPTSDRYTYFYRGARYLLDHMMVTPSLADAVEGVRIPHMNSRTTGKQRADPTHTRGASDHDPIIMRVRLED